MKYIWSETREQAVTAFLGETPGAQLEQDIIEHFTDDPERVLRTISRIADQHQRKPFDSCWAVLRADLKRTAQANVVADASASRARHIANAERWVANAGLHYDRWADVEADLFGDDHQRGRLSDYDTPELRRQLHDTWLEQRPRGEQAERDHEAWAERCKASRKILKDRIKIEADRIAAGLHKDLGLSGDLTVKYESDDIDFGA